MANGNKQLTLLTLFTAASGALIADSIITDRPDATESSSVVGAGLAQFEVGMTIFEDAEGERGTEYGSSLLRIGLDEKWELRLGWDGYLDADTVSGVSDGMIGFKYFIAEEGDSCFAPEMAVLVHTSLPIGKDELSTDAYDPNFLLSFSHTLSEQLSFGYNVGASWETSEGLDGDDDSLSAAVYSAALGYGVTDQLGFFIEIFGDVALSSEDSTSYIDGGFTWLFSDDSQLDCFAGFGLDDKSDDWFVGIGYSIRFGY